MITAVIFISRFYDNDNIPSFAELSAVIRLSHKYNIDSVLQQELWRLKAWYPTGFDQRPSGINPVDISDPSMHFAVINLARLTGTSTILPGAFYMCRNLGLDVVRKGHVREDGSKEYLASDALNRCSAGHFHLAREILAMTVRIFSHDPRFLPVARQQCAHPGCVTSNGKLIGARIWAHHVCCPYRPRRSGATLTQNMEFVPYASKHCWSGAEQNASRCGCGSLGSSTWRSPVGAVTMLVAAMRT